MKRGLKGHAAGSINRPALVVAVDHMDAIYQRGPVDDAIVHSMSERMESLLGADGAGDVVDFLKSHKGGSDYGPRARYDLHKLTAEAAKDGDPAQLMLAQRAENIKSKHPVECAEPSQAQQQLNGIMKRIMKGKQQAAQPAQ